MKKVMFLLVLFSFSYNANALGQDSSGITPATVSPVKGYTQTADVPLTPGVFVSDQANVCKQGEKRDSCFMRYTVAPNGAPAGLPQYNLVQSNLQCPTGYYIVAAFDNKVIDEKHPDDLIYYYDTNTVYPVTQAEYNTFTAMNFICDIPEDAKQDDTKIVEKGSKCTYKTCGGLAKDFKVIDGYLTKKTQTNTFTQYTYLTGGNACKKASTACPFPLFCQVLDWESYNYKQVSCKREGGFYKIPKPPSAELIASASSLYTPSVIICSKPNIRWN